MNADRFDRLENAIDKIHQTVVRIENDHNAKFEVIFDGLGAVNQRLDNVEAGQARLEQGQAKLEQGHAKLEQGQARLEQGHAKLEQGHAKLEQGQAKLEQGQARLEQGQAGMQVEIREINQTLGLLRPIANDHESRIQALETCQK
ncbi:MAG: hypothetical protein JRJ87_14170 [Deltaproteobacteria bacterium]|nr:hypothetical protein [Deltaproteobacteria bacterium]